MANKIKFFEHPEYSNSLEDFIKYRDLYEGKHDILAQSEYLWPHEFELTETGNKLRKVRESRTQYTNLIRPFIDRYNAMVFREDLIFTEAEKELGKNIVEDVDGNKTDYFSFLRNCVATNYFLYGRVILIADAFDIPGDLSVEEAEQLGKRPFLDCINPLDVKDWEIDLMPGPNYGKLVKVRYEYQMIEPRASLMSEPQVSIYCKVMELVPESNGFEWSTYKLRGERRGKNESWEAVSVGNFVPEFQQLPVVYYFGDSWIREVCGLALSLFNTESALDSQLLYQAFQRLIFRGNFDKEKKMPIHEGTALLVPGEGEIKVLEPTNPVALERRIDRIVNNMYKVAFNQTRHMPSDSKMVEAAESQRESKDDFLALVRQASKDLQDITNEGLRLLFDFSGKEFDEELHAVKYDLTVTRQDIEQEKEIMLAFMNEIKKFPSWHKAVLKKLANKMSLENIEEIELQIDALEQELQQEEPNPIDEVINADTQTS